MARRKTQRRTKQGAQGSAPASRPGAEWIAPDERREWLEGEAELYASVAKAHGLDPDNSAHRAHIEREYRQELGKTVRVADVLAASADRRSWERNTKPATDGKRREGETTRDSVNDIVDGDKRRGIKRTSKAIAKQVGLSADRVRQIRKDQGAR